MSYTRTRKVVYDQLLTDLAALKHYDDENCFASVKRVFIEEPTQSPVGQLMPYYARVENIGISSDERVLGWLFNVYEVMGDETTQDEADRKMNRLADLEDSILRYIEQIPNNLGIVDGSVRIVRTSLDDVQYSVVNSNKGLIVSQQTKFSTDVHIEVKSI